MSHNKKYERIGEIIEDNFGNKMKVIEYRSNNDCDVQLENNKILYNISYYALKKNQVKNPYFPIILNHGYIGEGEYKSRTRGKITKEYSSWYSILTRCYDEKYYEKEPSYKGCKICEEWLNFQNFAKWYNDNTWCDEKLYVDKDILVHGNKIYSPNTCTLVTREINNTFITKGSFVNGLPVGVRYDKERNKYSANCNIGKSNVKFIGRYYSISEAFNNYKSYKEKIIKNMANNYKNKYNNFPDKLYNSMINWEVYPDD